MATCSPACGATRSRPGCARRRQASPRRPATRRAPSRCASAADPAARSLAFEALVPNADHRIRPGFFGHGEVVVARDERALAVPRAALTSYAGVTKLFLIEDGVAREREVKLGVELGDGWAEIAEGGSQGKQVRTSGLPN